MIVRDLLIKLGFQSDLRGVDKADRQINQLKASSVALGQVMADLAMKGIGAATQEMRESAEASINFGRGIANLSSIMGGTEDDTRKMAQAAKDLGREFGVLPADISAAMYDVVGSLGFTNDTIAQTREAVKLGKAGAATTAEAFNVLSKTTLAYGDTSATAMKKVSDLASATIRLGVLTMPELSASLSSVTPMASSLGISLEELFGVQAALSGPSGTAAEVYTQMSSAMTGLLRKTTAMEGAFEKAFGGEGITTTKQAIGKYGLQGTLEKLIGTTDGTEEQLTELFGRIEAVRFALAVTGGQSDRYKEKVAELGKVTGEVDNAVRLQTTGMGAAGFALDKARAAAEAQRIELGDKLAPAYVQLNVLGGEIARLFGSEIVPLFTEANTGMAKSTQIVGGLEYAFKALGLVVSAVAVVIDELVSGLAAVGTLGAGVAAAVATGSLDPLKQAASDADALIMEAGSRSMQRLGLATGMRQTSAETARMQSADLAARQAALAADLAERQRRDPLGLGVASNSWDVGAVTINVSVPPGTEGSAAARIGSQTVTAIEAQARQSAGQGFPVQGASAWSN